MRQSEYMYNEIEPKAKNFHCIVEKMQQISKSLYIRLNERPFLTEFFPLS